MAFQTKKISTWLQERPTSSAHDALTRNGSISLLATAEQGARADTAVQRSGDSMSGALSVITPGGKVATIGSDGNIEIASSGSYGPYIDLKRDPVLDFETRVTLNPTDATCLIISQARVGPPESNGTSSSYLRHDVLGDQIDQMASEGAHAGVGKVAAHTIFHSFGASGGVEDAIASGGRNTFEVYCVQNGPTKADGEIESDRNYVAITGVSITSTGDGGTAPTLEDSKGAYFGGNFYGRLVNGATNVFNVTASEFNPESDTGTSCAYFSGIQINGRRETRGAIFDAMISLSDISGSARWKHGILFSEANGLHPVGSDGTLIGTAGSATVAAGIDFQSYTITGSVLIANGVNLSDGFLALNKVNAAIEIGSTFASGLAIVDFHSSGNSIDYDARIIASGGSTTSENGTLSILSKTLAISYDSTTRLLIDGSSDNPVSMRVGGVLYNCRLYNDGTRNLMELVVA